ncbi:MAG TPA: MauE/DoxX family redox-associated membrane protein [Steroidobacteraceae bacterium]|nr:MauE/DoxX family redox-associated membrane protein [Steroidobacteraceae bacterium]
MWHDDPVPAAILLLALLALWLAAGLHKLWRHRQFAGSLSAYALLPQGLIGAASWLLPLLELALAAGLIFERSRAYAGCAGAVTLAVYAAAIGINLRRGRRQLDCGCLAFGRRKQISAALLGRNAVLALASLLVGLVPVRARSLDWVDGWTILCGAATLALLYIAFEGLAESAQRLPRRRAR